jgi:predicted anti-sigma-YlaC factor YlaD
VSVLSFLSASHDEAMSLMSAYAEGELSGWRRWRVARHLAECDACRSLFRSVLAALDALRVLGRSEPLARPDIADAVVERIRRDTAEPEP